MVRKKKNTSQKKNRSDDSSDEDDSSEQSMPGLQERAREDSSSDGSSSSSDDDDREVSPPVSNNNNNNSNNNNNNRRNGGGRRRPAINNNNNDSSSSDDDDDDDNDDDSSATDEDIPPLSNRYNATGDSSSDSDLSDRGMPDLVGRARNDDSESDDASRSGSDDDDDDNNNNTNNNNNAPRARATRRRNNHGAARNSSSNNTAPTAPHVNNGDDNDSDSSAVPPDLIRRENNDDTSSDDSSDTDDDNNNNNNKNYKTSLASRKPAKRAKKAAAFADAIADTQSTTKKSKSKRQRKEEKKRLAKEAKKVEERKKKEAREKLAREKEKAARKEKKEYDCSTKIVAFYRQSIQQQRYNKLRYGFIRIQSLVRGKQSRKDNSNIIQHLTEFVLFYSLWGNCIQLSKSVEKDEPDWSSLREKQAYIRQQELMRDDEEDMKETDEKLTNSMADAMRTIEGKAAKLEDDIEEVHLPMKRVKIRNGHNGNSNGSNNNNTDVLLNFSRIHFSGDVVKWVRNGDPKYVGLFVKRMKSLSGGERSRILAKRLNGSTTNKVPIYETYLEQKSGYRILWTEKDDYLLVWYVANHDKVSRLMRLIDDSKSRSQRQRVSINDMDEMRDACHNNANTKDEDEIFLDPLGNVPLKVYDISINDIEDIKKRDWTPALHLTEEERKVVETEGTVLLLGRSGTGKTICICNRMEYDRQQFKSDPLFSQLFVARSPRLCTYVKNNIGESDGSEFVTFEMLLEELENTLPKVANIRDSFPENQFMRFSAFKQEIYDGDKGIDALVVWTNIRSFLKGSIEALKDSNLAVSEEEYISEENFGKKRCRLPTDQRKVVYEIFLEYQKRMSETNAWDNCDRIIALVQRLQAAKVSDPEMFEGAKIWCRWSKIYVDEVQDYTQAEILLFFYLTSGAGNLFLAGDPAQNVTKGVEFRFEDIRSVGYHIADGDRRLIPDKPQKVNVNFRSHAGILNAASSVLSMMFKSFPHAAKELGKDEGLFGGPRPGMFYKIKPETMATLVAKEMQGTVILTHDENVDECIKKLGGYELVYGIRKAKGLEFKSVIILDFFSSLPNNLQKPWRELLLNRADAFQFQIDHPEVEGQLKLLYTAVTRCIDTLKFAETEGSTSGAAFMRFAEEEKDGKPAIATRNKIGDIVNMSLTQDEWLASGITNAEAAEAEVSGDNIHAQSLMEKAIYCFKQASNDSFRKKAEIQLSSFKLRLKILNVGRSGTSADAESSSDIEKEAVELFVKLLKENLVLEAAGMGRDMGKILQKTYPSSAFLEKQILRGIKPEGGYSRGRGM